MIDPTAADALADAGRLLYGEEWQAPLARSLDLNRETLRRWLTGKARLTYDHGVFADLEALVTGAINDWDRRKAALDGLLISIHDRQEAIDVPS